MKKVGVPETAERSAESTSCAMRPVPVRVRMSSSNRSVVRKPPDAIRVDVADLVGDPPRLLFTQRVELASLDPGEVQHRRLEQSREEVTDDQGDRERVAAEHHFEQAERRLARILLRHARTDGGPIQADLLGPLDAGQLAEFFECVGHRLGIP